MKNKFQFLFIILLLGFGVLFSSCENEDSVIGLGLIPGSDKMDLVCDTIGVECFTVLDESISTDERTLATLGSFFDPDFGFTKASFICQTRISSNNVDFSEVETVNSLELHLKYDFHYGDSSTSQTINIYRLLTDVYIDSVYYSDFKPDASEIELLTSIELNIPADDSLVTIDLHEDLANEFIDPNNIDYFVDNDVFLPFFKGLYISTEDVVADGCIYNFNLYDEDSRMILYYNDTSEFEFLINTKSATINMFEHDYTTASTEVQAALLDTTLLYENCYIQSLGGLKSKIFFPELETLFDSTNIAINKAKLIISLEEDYNETVFVAPPQLTLVAILETGLYDFVTDYKVNTLNFGGEYDETNNTYSFNLPFHIQELVNGNTDYGLYLFATDNRTIPYRAIIDNSQDEPKGIQLEIYYSKY